MRFTLIGRTGPVFVVSRAFKAAGFIPCFHGVSEDGRFETVARVEDVDFVADVVTVETIEGEG